MHKYDKSNITKEELEDYLVALKTKTYKEIYETMYQPNHTDTIKLKSFCRYIQKKIKSNISTEPENMLNSASLDKKFTPYAATVQVNKDGDITQAWIKQNVNNSVLYDSLLKAIQDNTHEIKLNYENQIECSRKMLEIPLFDMHFGNMTLSEYSRQYARLIELIKSKSWDEINIIIGQDLFHNDNFDGTTANGTKIDKVDMETAWRDAREFYQNVISQAIGNSDHVNVFYSKGNHDRSIAWTFVQSLKIMFPENTYNIHFDDSMNPRKCISWESIFIGFGHCDYPKSKFSNLITQFIAEFPVQYSTAKIKEIHCGHLHTEETSDMGVLIRRLPTANKIDAWSSDQGYVDSNKRFMVFEYEPDFISDIHYI